MTPPTTLDRLWRAFRDLVRAELAEVRYLGIYEYVITASSSGYIDARPADPGLHLPALSRVPLLPSVLAVAATGTVGSTCAIAFLDGSPGRPVCVSLSAVDDVRIAGGAGFVALASLVDAHTHSGVTVGAGVTGPPVTSSAASKTRAA